MRRGCIVKEQSGLRADRISLNSLGGVDKIRPFDRSKLPLALLAAGPDLARGDLPQYTYSLQFWVFCQIRKPLIFKHFLKKCPIVSR